MAPTEVLVVVGVMVVAMVVEVVFGVVVFVCTSPNILKSCSAVFTPTAP